MRILGEALVMFLTPLLEIKLLLPPSSPPPPLSPPLLTLFLPPSPTSLPLFLPLFHNQNSRGMYKEA
ncbi:hypothetical protein Pmani_006331 [Petrolisthes manimaculis]|uniref:Uncharacterized protein n=1 Tax=Petrolisthes manimaculis TaxID=1843537 RepID=A0AAE1QBX6_9EUCA|nr:hypothetical protein Pmani_006331 [Petrolisthes manimaculis]